MAISSLGVSESVSQLKCNVLRAISKSGAEFVQCVFPDFGYFSVQPSYF